MELVRLLIGHGAVVTAPAVERAAKPSVAALKRVKSTARARNWLEVQALADAVVTSQKKK